MSTDATLFQESLTCTGVDHQKYDRVARLTASNQDGSISLTLDINIEIYPFSSGEAFELALTSTLNADNSKDDGKSWREVQKGESTLADHWDYVMNGKVYRFEEGAGESIKVFCSFGGLLLYIEGPYKRLTPLRSETVYLLMRKS